MRDIKNFLDPKSIALIGASDREASVGRVVLENLLISSDRRKIYPVNPNKNQILDMQSYAAVAVLPEKPDLAVICTPAATTPGIITECGKAGITSAIIISAGFREIGNEGYQREEKILKEARKYCISIIGPNCLGIIKPSTMLNTTFVKRIPRAGDIAFLSQSGALGSAALDWAVDKGIGFSTFISVGAMLDLDFGDLIDYFGEDPETKSIIIYAESLGENLKRTRKFMSAVRGFARNKPIIVLKPGKFEESARAAKSHTGSLVGNDSYYNAVFNRAGAVRVDEIEDLFNCASILNTITLPMGPNLAIITNAGGPGILATDALLEGKGKLAALSPKTLNALNEFLPPAWCKSNPIDILESAPLDHYTRSLDIVLSDPNVDGVVMISVPQGIADQLMIAKKSLAVIEKSNKKPVLFAMMGEGHGAQARTLLYERRIPVYAFPEDAVRTYLYMYQYARNLQMLYETPEDIPLETGIPKDYLKLLIRNTLKKGITMLGEEDSKKFLSTYRINATVPHPAKNIEEAISTAAQTGYPVVMKIVSPDISHKSDVGGIALNLSSADAVRNAFIEIIDNVKRAEPDARIEGVSIQNMITNYHYEMIIGCKKDPTFGPVIMFGQGGIDAEFHRDIAVGLPPLNRTLARRIIEQTKIYDALTKPPRNRQPVDLRLLDDTLIKISNMIVDFPEIKEMDINPLVINGDSIIALDARILLDETWQPESGEYDHLIIQPYPTKYIQTWRCKDGTEVLIRPIRPEDEPMEYKLLSSLSDESARFRFFHPISDINHDVLTRFCNIDYDREMAIVAETTADGKRNLIGSGRLVIQPDEKSGEFAIAVADSFQSRGLGLKLVDLLIGIGTEKGLQTIYAIALSDNKKMLALARKLGFTRKKMPAGETKLTLEL